MPISPAVSSGLNQSRSLVALRGSGRRHESAIPRGGGPRCHACRRGIDRQRRNLEEAGGQDRRLGPERCAERVAGGGLPPPQGPQGPAPRGGGGRESGGEGERGEL